MGKTVKSDKIYANSSNFFNDSPKLYKFQHLKIAVAF